MTDPRHNRATDTPTSGIPADLISSWLSDISPSIALLKKLAGTTETEFLQIGGRLQDFYVRSTDISAMANRLVELVSGDQAQILIGRLRQMVADMESYLTSIRSQSLENCTTLERVMTLLDDVSRPLEGFQKMYKILRMLATSTKIESARMGEAGTGFLTLAQDVEKLSLMVNEKSTSILAQRQLLAGMIFQNLQVVRKAEAAQDEKVRGILDRTVGSLNDVVAINERCSQAGEQVSAISAEVSANISEVVTSQQAHDITRQQEEHIIEALERLVSDLQACSQKQGDAGDERLRALVVEAGDVCELQTAQLHHASHELHEAVKAVIDNLRDVARKQALMADEMLSTTGVANSSGSLLFDRLNGDLATITAVLSRCAQDDREMSDTMHKVADIIGEITSFVTDIEDIGSEIDLIALNAQIKAAHTGREGAALGVLAEAIKRLSLDAVIHTEEVSRTLTNITTVTESLFRAAENEINQLGGRVSLMEDELATILRTLGAMNSELLEILSGLNARVSDLTADISQVTASITVHEQSSLMANQVNICLERIVERARQVAPASTEFKENLRHMEERYTMQSERRIHESIARKRSGASALSPELIREKVLVESTSEFGDNVDLF